MHPCLSCVHIKTLAHTVHACNYAHAHLSSCEQTQPNNSDVLLLGKKIATPTLSGLPRDSKQHMPVSSMYCTVRHVTSTA